jgi:hypothetical protein
MRACLWLVALLLVCISSAQAGEPWLLFDGYHWAFPKQRNCCCCPDDYCPKPLPHVPPNAKGCVDDYCPRTCPLLLQKPCEPWYSCGRSQEGGVGACPNSPPRQ